MPRRSTARKLQVEKKDVRNFYEGDSLHHFNNSLTWNSFIKTLHIEPLQEGDSEALRNNPKTHSQTSLTHAAHSCTFFAHYCFVWKSSISTTSRHFHIELDKSVWLLVCCVVIPASLLRRESEELGCCPQRTTVSLGSWWDEYGRLKPTINARLPLSMQQCLPLWSNEWSAIKWKFGNLTAIALRHLA